MKHGMSDGLRGSRSLDDKLARVIALLVAQGSIIYASYHIGHVNGEQASGAFVTEFPYRLNGLHLYISAGLTICAISLWSRKNTGVIVSLGALLSVCLIYGVWHFRTLKYLAEYRADTELYKRVSEDVGFLHGATRWDLAVLAVVVILLFWHIFRLAKIVIPTMK